MSQVNCDIRSTLTQLNCAVKLYFISACFVFIVKDFYVYEMMNNTKYLRLLSGVFLSAGLVLRYFLL